MLKKILDTKQKQSGITLIALIITIIILIILAAVTINIALGENGIIELAKKSVFYNDMQHYNEKINLKIVDMRTKNEGYVNPNISVGLEGEESIKTILPNISKDYENEVIVQNNIMYFKYAGTEKSKKRAKWCFELGIPVWGYDTFDELIQDELSKSKEPYYKGEYINVGGVYSCAPDLSGFNVECTYYVYYVDGKEYIGNTVNQVPPDNWYNYKEKRWANIVTINNDNITYFTWIPRYLYTINNST